MKMFQQMLESVSKQREASRKPASPKDKTQPANFQGKHSDAKGGCLQRGQCGGGGSGVASK